ncbi:hypothetical protein [Rhizobium leguminosarum]|uniref:hypothetical protein n=1 Tax=Rhizobium leguminosarum TaxID=384 RepID=UPI003F98640E
MTAFGEKEWQEHAALIGVVSLTWNQTVHQLLRIFCHLTGLESPLAEAIFFSPQSDSVQRNLIKRVATAVGLAERDQKMLERLLKRLEGASRGRNLATHMIFGITAFDQETGIWGPKSSPPSHRRKIPASKLISPLSSER